jgi:SAM-dependent methyltransferase
MTTVSSPPGVRCNLCSTPLSPEQEPVWRKDGFDIVACPSCRLVFRRDLPTPAELDRIYAGEYFRRPDDEETHGYLDYLADEDAHRLSARKRLELLTRHTAPGRLLDVGAAAGFFMDEARRAGWEVWGIDVSAEMARWGAENLGLRLETGVFERWPDSPDGLDCVTMWDYIEHAVDPAASFARAREALAPGGVLAISTGDVGSIVARVSGQRWHLLTPRHHNFYFSETTIRRYLDRAEFEVIEAKRRSAPYSVRYCAYKLAAHAPSRRLPQRAADWLAKRPIGERAIPVNLWDVMTVVARRRA